MVFVKMFVRSLRSSHHSVRIGQLLPHAHKRIVNTMKVYIEKNNKHVELTRFRFFLNSDFIDTLKWEYSFATAVFTKLGSLLSGTSRHCSVLRAPDVSGHDHIGTRHFGTDPIRYIITSVHAQFGT